MALELCWIYIHNGWYYKWMVETHSIMYLEQPFFKSCGLLSTIWIKFFHLLINFMHIHFHYTFQRLLGTGISLPFHPSLVHDNRSFERSVVCTNSSLHFPSYCYSPPYLCFSFVGRWYVHNWSCLERVICFFTITWKNWSIRTFNAIDKMCSLVSREVKPVYIISFRFSYTCVQSSYSRCSNGFFAICGVLRIKGTPRGPQHNRESSYACRSSCNFCDAFILVCLVAKLLTTYCISIIRYLVVLYP
jgi:hypothetical protein